MPRLRPGPCTLQHERSQSHLVSFPRLESTSMPARIGHAARTRLGRKKAILPFEVDLLEHPQWEYEPVPPALKEGLHDRFDRLLGGQRDLPGRWPSASSRPRVQGMYWKGERQAVDPYAETG